MIEPIDEYAGLERELCAMGLAGWAEKLHGQLEHYFADPRHGDYEHWRQAIKRLPDLPLSYQLNQDTIRFGADADSRQQPILIEALRDLMPWRKGPLNIGGVDIDSEWRSDWKWQRVAPHLSDLHGRRVLDVGCGNAYYAWRMLGAGARTVIGVDPTLLFVMQWLACRRYAGSQPVWVLPLRLEDIPATVTGFDSAFSMGVLYHRRDPLEHLRRLHGLLRAGGELVLETLVVTTGEELHLSRKQRYARMRNVWCVPFPRTVMDWLGESGFKNIRLVDITATNLREQRRTSWMSFESLTESLDQSNPGLTIEGLPAPVRAIYVAQT